jgi:hypothetical protein
MTTSESTDALTSLAPMLTGTPGDWTATPGQAATPSRRELVRFSLSPLGHLMTIRSQHDGLPAMLSHPLQED